MAAVLQVLSFFLLAMCCCSPALAGDLDGWFLDPTMFGHMVQPNESECAPTAVVNSFLFLQKQYPSLYGQNLVVPTDEGMLKAEKELAVDMKTKATGTTAYNIAVGKQTYLDVHAAGTSVVGGELSGYWPWGIDRPPDVKSHTKPTADYIIANLKLNRDIEIDFAAVSDPTFGHAVTVYGMTWDSELKIGGIYYIDPADGKTKKQLVSLDEDGYISWDSPDLKKHYELNDVYWEGPVPEPGTWMLLGSGVLSTTALLRRRTTVAKLKRPRPQ